MPTRSKVGRRSQPKFQSMLSLFRCLLCRTSSRTPTGPLVWGDSFRFQGLATYHISQLPVHFPAFGPHRVIFGNYLTRDVQGSRAHHMVFFSWHVEPRFTPHTAVLRILIKRYTYPCCLNKSLQNYLFSSPMIQ